MNIVDPRGLTPAEWCDYTADNLVALVQPMKVPDDEGWRAFGDYILSAMRRRGTIVPDNRQFVAFEEWAMRFNQVISTLGA